MAQLDWNTLVVMATVFATGGTGALWLSSQFRRVEKIIYEEIDRHKREDQAQFSNHGDRILKLEMKNNG